MEATAIVLAGGKSSRMGTNKALLEISGRTVIERITNELQRIVNNIIIVNNSFEHYEFLNLPMVKDEWEGLGPLAGLHAGLTASNTQKNLVVACDMPFISAEIGAYLLEQLSEFDCAVPIIHGQRHPLFSSFRRDVKEVVETLIQEQKFRMAHILPHIHAKMVTEKDLQEYGLQVKDEYFFNMNHPEEFEYAKKHDEPKS